jgi:transposase
VTSFAVVALDLRKEKDPEILRQAALLLERENQHLVRQIAKLVQEITTLRGGNGAEAARRLEQLELQLARLQKDLFGPKSERSNATPDDKGDGDKTPPAKKNGHGRRAQPLLPLIGRSYDLDEADRVCTQCGQHLEVFAGQAERSNEVHVVRRVFINLEHVQQKYRCPNGCCIETAPGPRKLFRGARYSIGFALEVAIQKYLFHMPLARQVRQMRGEGLEIDTQTLWDQLERLATILGPAYERVRAFVLSHPVVGADETKWRMMGKAGPEVETGKTWQVWTLAVPRGVYYRIQDSRSHHAAMKMLEGFKGVVMCDGYKAYNLAAEKLGGVLIAHCWAHVRRAFKDIAEFFPQDTEKVINLINELFAIEKLVPADDDPETLDARRALRAQRSKPIVDQIGRWAVEVQTMPGSGLAKAIDYMTGVWSGLKVFLDDPAVALSNNITERANRDPVLGRKNHYGSRSVRGTEVAALLYTLLETAKLTDVDPHAYLEIAVNAALDGRQIPLPHEVRDEARALAEQHLADVVAAMS